MGNLQKFQTETPPDLAALGAVWGLAGGILDLARSDPANEHGVLHGVSVALFAFWPSGHDLSLGDETQMGFEPPHRQRRKRLKRHR